VNAFDSAFMAIVLLFALAAPILVAIKIGFAHYGNRGASPLPPEGN